jgi:hypothetical protein
MPHDSYSFVFVALNMLILDMAWLVTLGMVIICRTGSK